MTLRWTAYFDTERLCWVMVAVKVPPSDNPSTTIHWTEVAA